MSVKDYKNGAFQDIETLRRYEDGAWKDCEAAYKHENGTWKEVWRSMGLFYLAAFPQYGIGNVYDDNKTMTFFQSTNGVSGTMPNSGYIDIRLDGEWVNPMLSFDWEGGLTYWNASYTRGYRTNAGSIKLQGYWGDQDGQTGITEFVTITTVGSYASWNNSVELHSGNFSKNVSDGHTYNRLRLIITPVNTTSSLFDATKEIAIRNFYIGGKQAGFSDEINFDKG